MFSGKYLTQAEKCLEKIYSGRKALLLNSGTSALHIALKCYGIGPGDEVILPAITYPATALAVTYVGAKPVFADISPDSFTLNMDSCKQVLTKNTKAIIFVHLFGVLGNIEQITDFCTEQGLILIEDCAQAFGSSKNGKLAGTFGQAGCFSFFESKTISAGEGGALLFSDPSMHNLGRRYRHHGMDVLHNDRTVSVTGFNYKPSEFQSALVLAQLTHCHEIIHRKKRIAALIGKYLSNDITLQSVEPEEDIALDKLCLIFDDIKTYNMAKTYGKPIGLFHYLKQPLYKEPVFLKSKPSPLCSVAEYFCSHHLVLQISPYQVYSEVKKHINFFITNFKEINNETISEKACD
jgi:perosamine synthetase